MELLYLWVEDHRNIKDQGFNFSPEFRFHHKFESASDRLTIRQTNNNNFIPDFFNHTNIKNVTAIIGENGAGKSNILDLLKDIFAQGAGHYDLPKYLVIVRLIDANEKTFLQIYHNTDYNIDFPPYTEASGSIQKVGTENSKRKITDLHGVELIFYSNIFDFRHEGQPAGLNNISTNYLLESAWEHIENSRFATNEITEGDRGLTDRLVLYRINELLMNARFAVSKYRRSEHLPFKFPERLMILPLSLDEKFLKGYNDFGELLQQLEEKIDKSEVLNFEGQRAYLEFLSKSLLCNFLKSFATSNAPYTRSIIEEIRSSFSTTYYNTAIKFFKGLRQNKEFSPDLKSSLNERAKRVLNFLNFIKKKHPSWQFDHTAIIINVDSSDFDSDLKKLIHLNIQAKGTSEFLRFEWRDISSGERSIFTLFSRFYWLEHHSHSFPKEQRNLMILIDEGDVYFHPEWQRKLLSLLIDFLPVLFSKRRLQIIITTNTPFLAADLPKANIVFLKKCFDSKANIHHVEVTEDLDMTETFAANIHDLYRHNFFMKEGALGDFAKQKINDLIAYINQSGRNYKSRYYYQKLLNSIGDPVIKHQLESMWLRAFSTDERIKYLKDELAKLERVKQNDQNK